MPIYEYACSNCEHTLDALQKMSEESLIDCPECGKPQLKRLISAPRFRLKGAGWYETDFKKDNQRNVLKGDSEPAKSNGTEGKPEKAEPSSPAPASKPEKTADKKSASKTD